MNKLIILSILVGAASAMFLHIQERRVDGPILTVTFEVDGVTAQQPSEHVYKVNKEVYDKALNQAYMAQPISWVRHYFLGHWMATTETDNKPTEESFVKAKKDPDTTDETFYGYTKE